MSRSWRAWRALSPYIANQLRQGVHLEWETISPRPTTLYQPKLSKEEHQAVDKAVEELIAKAAVEKAPNPRQCVVSPMFTTSKRDSDDRRPILNLKYLNRFIKFKKFKTTTLRHAKEAIQEGDWMTKIDLSDAFFQVSVHKDHRRFLAFRWHGETYQYTCLPFGLTSSPRTLAETLRPIISQMTKLGHRVVKYVDDWLIMAPTKEAASKATADLINLFETLGVTWNRKKSVTSPSQSVEYLGCILDSVAMTCTVPKRKITSLRKELKNSRRGYRQGKPTSARNVARLLGRINAMGDAMDTTKVHTNGLYQLQLSALRKCGWDQPTAWSDVAKNDVTWWIQQLYHMNGKSLILRKPTRFAATDASDYGWGFHLMTQNPLDCKDGRNPYFTRRIQASFRSATRPIKSSGLFTQQIRSRHINFKELITVKYLLSTTAHTLKNQLLEIAIDNQVTVSYINKMGGRVGEMAKLSDEIFDICQRNNLQIQARWIPSEDNVAADYLSRKTNTSQDWKLSSTMFKWIQNRWGPHTIDLFATMENKLLKSYGSFHPQPGAFWQDSMSHSWEHLKNPYANPPPCLLQKVLAKVLDEKTTITLLTPLWWAASWLPTVASMATAMPMILPKEAAKWCLRPNGVYAEVRSNWSTVAWRISGNAGKRRAFRQKLKTTLQRRGQNQLSASTAPPGSTTPITATQRELTSLILKISNTTVT
jgi:hypothetical protein